MPVVCLTGTRFTMAAEVLKWTGVDSDPLPDPEGEWVTWQDPISGEIYNKWVSETPDDPETPENEYVAKPFPCLARGIVDGGIRVAGSTERFGDMYENIDFVKLWVPPRIKLAKSNRITNIRARRGGTVMWKDYDTDAPIVFNVNGVTPLFNAFNRHVESFAILERADEVG